MATILQLRFYLMFIRWKLWEIKSRMVEAVKRMGKK